MVSSSAVRKSRESALLLVGFGRLNEGSEIDGILSTRVNCSKSWSGRAGKSPVRDIDSPSEFNVYCENPTMAFPSRSVRS